MGKGPPTSDLLITKHLLYQRLYIAEDVAKPFGRDGQGDVRASGVPRAAFAKLAVLGGGWA
jgi:hypothetical protein